MKLKHVLGIVIILLIIATYLKCNIYHCLILKSTALSEKLGKMPLSGHYDIIILNDKNMCGTCPPGYFLYSIGKNKDIVYFVPEYYGPFDIENLRYAFEIRGEIIRSNAQTKDLLKRISRCTKDKYSTRNYYLRLDKNTKIKKVEAF